MKVISHDKDYVASVFLKKLKSIFSLGQNKKREPEVREDRKRREREISDFFHSFDFFGFLYLLSYVYVHLFFHIFI